MSVILVESGVRRIFLAYGVGFDMEEKAEAEGGWIKVLSSPD